MKTGKCLKCGKTRKLTLHHCLPRRHFHGAGLVRYLCRACHNIIDRRNDEAERYCYGNTLKPLPRETYLQMFNQFLAEADDENSD